MSYIPRKALKFGAESLTQYPIKYSKTKISGSKNTTYILHSKGGCMPGQPEIFNENSRKNPDLSFSVKENRITRAFQLEKLINERQPIGKKYITDSLSSFTYDEFYPHDDHSLNIAIKAAYKQIYGNLYPFESERPIEVERRLRNGDLNIREFVRQLAKSIFYRVNYFENVNQQRFIELNFKHILGRPPFGQDEVIKSIKLLNDEGFDQHIDLLVDSKEYFELFGDHTVPFMHCWDSPCGVKTSSFINSSLMTKSFATSDNAIHSQYSNQAFTPGRCMLLKQMIS